MIVPFTDLPPELRASAYAYAERRVRELMIEQGIVKDPKDVAVRGLIVGDESNAADFVDLDVKTAVATGQEGWGQDANDLTDYTFSSILATGETVPDNKVIVFFGFVDLTADPDLVAIRFKRGSDVLDIWEVEHCYKSSEEVGGLAFTYNPDTGSFEPYVVSYVQNDKIDIEMIFRDGSVDKRVVLLALIGERYGDTITKTAK